MKNTISKLLKGKGIVGRESYEIYKEWKKLNNSRITCTTWLNLPSEKLNKIMKYLIVDTFNGEGYTDSKYHVREFESIAQCRDYCVDLAKQCAGNEFVIDDGEGVTYTDDDISSFDEVDDAEDHGCVHYQQLNGDEVAVCINPLVNEYWVLTSKDEVDETVKQIMEYSADYKEVLGGDLAPEDAPFFNHCHHEALAGDGDIIMQLIQQSH